MFSPASAVVIDLDDPDMPDYAGVQLLLSETVVVKREPGVDQDLMPLRPRADEEIMQNPVDRLPTSRTQAAITNTASPWQRHSRRRKIT